MAKKLAFILFLVLLLSPLRAQRHEIGVQAGMANLVGDIGRTNYILQKPLNVSDYALPATFSLLYRMNFNPYQTLRFNLGTAGVQFSDAAAKETYRRNRGISGTNTVYNADAIFEYNFLPVNNEQRSMLSPYIFGGVGGIFYSKIAAELNYGKTTEDPLFYQFEEDADGNLIINNDELFTADHVNRQFKTAGAFSIPFGAGLKYKFNYNWALFGEFKFRYTFTDKIDYSAMDEDDVKIIAAGNSAVLSADGSTTKKLSNAQRAAITAAYLQGKSVGNKNSNDWVNSITLGISYSFGRPPCYCD